MNDVAAVRRFGARDLPTHRWDFESSNSRAAASLSTDGLLEDAGK
jgi:hypothetical protein